MSQYAKEIKHILATLSEQGDEDDAPLPDEEEIDTIHVYPVEGGGILLTRVPRVFVLGDLADNQLLALMTPIVSVTIVPQTQIVTATADLPAATIQAHSFSPLTLSMSQTVPASGIGHQDARAATGTVTVGTIHPTILAKQETANIHVQFTGTYVYQINQQALTTLIAGQLKHHALQLLATQPGIQHVMITGLTDDNPVPIDPAHIHFQVLIGL